MDDLPEMSEPQPLPDVKDISTAVPSYRRTFKGSRRVFLVTTIVFVIAVVGFVFSRAKNMSRTEPKVTVIGLEDFAIRLQLAYPGESWQELVLTNESERHLIATVLLYELIRRDGTRALIRDVIFDPRVSMEPDPVRKKHLISEHPVIPPKSAWLVGAGVDRTELIRGLPSFEETRGFVSQEFSLNSVRPPAVTEIRITIEGTTFDDGRVVGKDPRPFVEQILKKLREE